jgi:hypothetical protein
MPSSAITVATDACALRSCHNGVAFTPPFNFFRVSGTTSHSPSAANIASRGANAHQSKPTS